MINREFLLSDIENLKIYSQSEIEYLKENINKFSESFVECLDKRNKNEKFFNINFLTYMYEEGVFYKLSEEEKLLVCDLYFLKCKNINLSLFPSYILENDYFLYNYLDDNELRYLIKNIVGDSDYSIDLEVKFLTYVNSDSENIKEFLKKLINEKNFTNRLKMDILDVLAINLFCKKYLFENNIKDSKLSCFAYSYLDNKKGSYDDANSCINLYISKRNESFLSLIKGFFHEVVHYKQYLDVINGNILNDEDVDLYTKDQYIRNVDILYYMESYKYISFEFDADYKAQLMFIKEFGFLQKMFNKYKSFVLEELSENDEFLKDVSRSIDYSLTNLRVYGIGYLDIETIFIDILKYSKNKEIFKTIKTRYPLIAMDYNLDTCLRKSISELVYDLLVSNNEIEREKYYKLIEQRLYKRKNKQYKKETLNLLEIVSKDGLPIDVKNRLSQIVNKNIDNKDKFYKYKIKAI